MLILTEQRPGATSSLEFSKIWQVLGPFQIGTREATWGSDPLELHGGFSSLEPGENLFSSSLAPLGQVSWSERQADVQVGKAPYKGIEAEEKSYTTAKLSLSFPDVDWNLLQLVYGWSALQWQAWIRGTLIVQGDQALTIELSLPGILEFEIDGDRHFGGDYFAFARVPLVKALNPGSHMLNVRVVRDVRAMGAVGQPIVDLSFLAHQVSPSLHVLAGEAVFPDVVSDRGYAGNVCSIPVQNTGHLWLEVLGIVVEDVSLLWPLDTVILNTSSPSMKLRIPFF